MIQAAMYFSLGLLVAGLLALVVTPSIWRRAMRLARARIEAGVPLTRAEINADKDQLRAGFAIANRRLEMETSRLKEKLAQESVALGRRNDEVAVLARGNTSLTEAVSRLETRAEELEEARALSERKLAAAEAAVIERDTALAESESTLASLRADLGASQLMTEELRLEMVARATEISNLHDSLAMVSGIEAATAAARDRIGEDLAAEREQTAAEQKRFLALEASFATLQTERSGRIAEIERRTAQVRMLEAEIAELRAERDAATAELSAARSAMNAVASDIVDEGDNVRKVIAATEAQNTELNRRLAAMEDDFAALRAENADLRRVAGADWESEREENRRLRERLNEIAVGVVRLSQASAKDAAADETRTAEPIPLASVQRPATAPAETADTTLAERLRALQHAGARH